jgi:hypothetical protein
VGSAIIIERIGRRDVPKLKADERTTLERAVIAHLQDTARCGATATDIYLDDVIDVNPAVGDAEELTLRDVLRMLRQGRY